MKRVLLVKIEAPSYSSVGIETAFKEHFEEVHSIDWQRVNFNTHGEGVWKEIYTKCLEVMPDLIFCQFQKQVLTEQQWKTLGKIGFVVNYTEDVREDISWYENIAPHIGLTVFTNLDDVERFKHNNVAYMMVGYNHLWYRPVSRTEKYYGDIVFIGNNYVGSNLNFPYAQERQDMIKAMKDAFGDKFQSYGLGQENQILSPAHCIEAYNNCKIVITHNNFRRKGYCSDRGLNAMGCGAITIHQHFEGIEEMFTPYSFLPTWNTFDELIKYCEYYLQEHRRMNEMFGYHKNSQPDPEYMKENHSWLNRVKVLHAMIKVMNGDKPRQKFVVHEFD